MAKNKIEVIIVGAQEDDKLGRSIVYVQFFKDGKPMQDQLWALTYPGNLTVEKWRDSMVRQENGELKFDSSIQTEAFFRNCIRPLGEPLTPLEKSIVSKYGNNKSPKPDPNTIHPKLFGVWQKLQNRFLGGDIFDEISELGEPSV